MKEREQAQARTAELEALLEGACEERDGLQEDLDAALVRNVHAKFTAKMLCEACLYFLNAIDNDTGAKDYALAIKKIRQAVAFSTPGETSGAPVSNMMSGDNSGAWPKEHDSRCRTQCDYADVRLTDDDECPEGHHSHECNCDHILDADYEATAEAWAEWTAERRAEGWNIPEGMQP